VNPCRDLRPLCSNDTPTMSNHHEAESSIRTLLTEADALKEELGSYPDSNSDEYQSKLSAALKKYEDAKDVVARASMFSLNESLEDMATADMRYKAPLRGVCWDGWMGLTGICRCLLIPFHIAELNMRVKSTDRKAVLQRSMTLYKDFITYCDAYELVSKEERTAAENAGTGRPVSTLPTDPGARRTAKIAQFKAEKELKARIEVYPSSPLENLLTRLCADAGKTTELRRGGSSRIL
jgi:immunoglobulin-binding protein 1